MAAVNTKKVQELLEKMKHYDADERSMATSDLINELKNAQLEATLQAPVRQAILLQLEDKSPNVSTIAVKCLSTIVTQFAPEHLVAIVDKLGTLIGDPDKQEIRELVADASKTVIAAVSVESGKTVMVTFTRSLINGLNAKATKEGGLELSCLDVLKDVLAKFGPELAAEHATILNTIQKLLEHPNESVRKRATVTVGPLVVSLTDDVFTTFMTAIIKKIESTRKPDIYIQTIGSVSTAAGVRVAPFLDKIIPSLERFCKIDEKKAEESTEEDVELWESCLKSLESIVRRCPNKVTPYVAGILSTATIFLAHDPNYSYDMDGGSDAKAGDDDGFGGDDDGWGDDGGDDAWGDDDDAPKAKKAAPKAAAKTPAKAPAKAAAKPKSWNMPGEGVQDADTSWKVRAAAIRVISAFIRVRSDILKTYYSQLSDTLVSRFKERDSAVKEEILLATRDLLHETVVSGRAPVADKEEASLAVPEFIRTRSSYETLDLKVVAIVDGCDKEFKTGDVRTQKAIMTLLSELVLVRQGDLSVDKILPHVVSGIEGAGEYSAVNADALKLLHFVLEFHKFAQISAFVPKLTAAAVKAVKTGNQAIIPDALRVLGSITKTVSKQPGQEGIARDAFKAVFSQLVLNDVPQKMKLSAISAMATVLASFGGVLVAETKQAVPVLTDRLGNDVTRQPALRAFTKIANSETKADLSLLAANSVVIKEVSTFVRKALPVLRHETVTCLEALLRTHASHFKAVDVAAIITEVASHVTDEDLSMAHLVLELVSTSLTVSAAAAASPVARDVLPKAIILVKSPLLQGNALHSLIKFFATTVASNSREAPLQYPALLATLFGVVDASLSKSSRLAVAQCIAGMTKRAGADKIQSTVTKCIGDVTKAGNAAPVQIAALLTLGAIGQSSDLSENKSVESVITGAFDSKDDETRAAAAYALGNVAVGNLARFLPSLLALIGSRPTYQYLLFSALKEAISAQSKTRESMAVFVPYVDTISPILTKQAESKDEGVRDMVAQCLGLLSVLDPVKLLAILERFVRATDANLRVVAMVALRFAFSPLTNWPKLGEKVDLFLSLLRDTDLGVRRQAVLTLNALARANIETIPGEALKRNILPALYEEAKPHPELVREVDFGAFKETIDDGLPLRKAAFQCLGTLLDVAPHRLNMQEFIGVTKQGLVDHPDIQVGTFQIFSNIALLHGSSLLEVLDSLPDLIMKSVKAHIQASKTKEPEQALDCLRAIVRAMTTFSKIPGVEQATKYIFFTKQIAATPLLAQMQKEQDA